MAVILRRVSRCGRLGQLVRYEEDATILFSLKAYREFFQECDRRIAASFDYALIHTHSANHKLIHGTCYHPRTPGNSSILDPTGPAHKGNGSTTCKRFKAADKALLITHELRTNHLNALLDELSPRGLAVERMISV